MDITIRCNPPVPYQVHAKRGIAVKDEPSLRGKKLAVLAHLDIVEVHEIQGDNRFVRIKEPVAGWISTTRRGRQVVRKYVPPKEPEKIHYEILGSTKSAEFWHELVCAESRKFFYKSPLTIVNDICGIVLSYLRLPKGKQFLIGDELWISVEDREFKRSVAFLKVSYPWSKCQKTPPIEDHDAYLDTLELWHRFNVQNDFHTMTDLNKSLLDVLKIIIKNSGCSGLRQHGTNNITSNTGLYMLQTEYGMKSEMILGDEIPEQLFDEVWSVYGDDLAEVRISQELTRTHWPLSSKQIRLWKSRLSPMIRKYLYPSDLKHATVRHVCLTMNEVRDCTFEADMLIGSDCALIQSAHFEHSGTENQIN